LDTHITWGTTGANPIQDFWIAAKCIQLNTTDLGNPLGCGEKVLVGGNSACVEWKTYQCPAFQSVENGLVQSSSAARMGGTFNQLSTTIDGLGTNSYTLINLDTNEVQAKHYKVRVNGTYGALGQTLIVSAGNELTYQNIPVLPPLVYTGVNGINVTGTNINLGGTLTDALTEINGMTLLNFRFRDINTFEVITGIARLTVAGSSGIAGQALMATGAGDYKWSNIVIPPGVVTANNGLTATGNNVQLRGGLNQDTTIFGSATWFLHLNSLTNFRLETVTCSLYVNGSTGTAGQVFTANGTTGCGWQDPAAFGLILGNVITGAAIYNANYSDGVIYLTGIDQLVQLPAIVNGKLLFVVPKNIGVNNRIAPDGVEVLYDGTTSYNAGAPYIIPLEQPTLLQAVDNGVKFWQVLSRN
jgi:hypothetical protein